jgi:DNA helicase-2/ATP-dependent DNA helicase PcrA
MYKPRPKQQEVIAFRHGKMGISAVPGSGKTQTLSYLAAKLIAEGLIDDDQEILVVTLVNSAVENFSLRVANFVQEMGLMPHLGYRVRTLHGLAHDIVRERPELAGLSDSFQIVDEFTSSQILRGITESYMRVNSPILESFQRVDLTAREQENARKRGWPQLMTALATSFIKQAKDLLLSPNALNQRLAEQRYVHPMLQMAADMYTDYQRALNYRGAVDFDDLIGKALLALQADKELLERLRSRWPYILEDEAQDSSRLQETILRLLVGPRGNWVRVGDPNQAIFETFTTASPQFLRDFLDEPGVEARTLPNSGRSTASILYLANHLIEWTLSDHPVKEVRNALAPPYIEPTPDGDPQPNPPDDPDGVRLISSMYTSDEEVRDVVRSVIHWLEENPEGTVAVLVPTNILGARLVEQLKAYGAPYTELLRSTSATRETAHTLAAVLQHLVNPTSRPRMVEAFLAWCKADPAAMEAETVAKPAARKMGKCRKVEDYLWPQPGNDWLANLSLADAEAHIGEVLTDFRTRTQRWHSAVLLPIDQLILTLAQDLFTEPADLAMSQKLALLLERYARMNPGLGLPDLIRELETVVKNERALLGLSHQDLGFDPERHRGVVVVATVHKAKGLEWDRVYLMAVNNYDYPSAEPDDEFYAEKWFVRDRLNLEAEVLAQLRALVELCEGKAYVEHEETARARFEIAAERLRLLFVGITRARRELVITWNVGRKSDKHQATPFVELAAFWEGRHHDPAD